MASGDTKTNQYLDVAANGTRADIPSDTCCETRTQALIRGVAERVMNVEDEVEELKNNPDVVDIVATYTDLQNYDTTSLTDKDIIRVLQDETHDGNSTYYRYTASTGSFTYIGESKQYTDFVGTDGTTDGTNGLVPAPTTTDVGKFLKADGTWDNAGGGTLYGTTGTNTDGAMTQKATSEMIFAAPTYMQKVKIGSNIAVQNVGNESYVAIGERTKITGANGVAIGQNSSASYGVAIGSSGFGVPGASANSSGVAIGYMTQANGQYAVAIGANAGASANDSVAIGRGSESTKQYSIAIGRGSYPTREGEVHIGSINTAYGHNSSNYRILGGVYDGQDAHDAVTVGQINATIDAINTALSVNIPHIGANS